MLLFKTKMNSTGELYPKIQPRLHKNIPNWISLRAIKTKRSLSRKKACRKREHYFPGLLKFELLHLFLSPVKNKRSKWRSESASWHWDSEQFRDDKGCACYKTTGWESPQTLPWWWANNEIRIGAMSKPLMWERGCERGRPQVRQSKERKARQCDDTVNP